MEGQTRRIPLSRRSHIIGFQPLATGTAEHESALERDFVTLTSFQFPDATIIAQPVTIAFQDGDQERRYTPDFLIRSGDDRRADLIEVKYRDDLRTQWGRLRPAFHAARRWARSNFASFGIATERQIRGPMLANAKRLLPLRRAPLDPKLAMLALDASARLSNPTFGSVVLAMPVSRREALAIVWRLVARGALRVDVSEPITFDTPILL